jgi:hypothetical protein
MSAEEPRGEGLNVAQALFWLVEEDAGVAPMLARMRQRAGYEPSQVDAAMGWPAGRCEAVEAGQVRFDDRREAAALLGVLGGREVAEAALVEVAAERLGEWASGGRTVGEMMVVFSAYLAVSRGDPELLEIAALELSLRRGRMGAAS